MIRGPSQGYDWRSLILDLRLPGLAGAEVLRRMRDRKLPTRVIVLTASAAEEELFEAVRCV